MNELTDFFRFWVLPPFLGGVIGYITNAIAIRMLFRPLKEIRLWGVKLPFTPGVIPRQRYQLSQSIANLITEQLLTSEAIQTQLAEGKLRQDLKTKIIKLISQLMETRLKDLPQTRLPFLALNLSALLKALTVGLARTPAWHKLIDFMLAELSHKIYNLKLGVLNEKLKPAELLARGLEDLLKDEESSGRLADLLCDWLKSEAIRPDLAQSLDKPLNLLIQALWPFLKNTLASWLHSQPMQELLQTKGKEFLADVFARLNTLQRLFLSLGQYERSLKQAMPEIISDLTKRLDEILDHPSSKESLQASLSLRLKDGLSRLVASDAEGVRLRIAPICQKVISLARSLKLPQLLTQRLNHYLSQNQHDEVGQLWKRLSPSFQAELKVGLGALFKSLILTFDFSKVIAEFSKQYAEVSLGELLDLRPVHRLKLAAKLTQAFIHSFPPTLELLDLKKFIVQKIDALSVKDVENMLLSVMAKHFKWINIFGAILGSLMGLGQVLLRLL